ncbi:MAG: uroporphyrinogen-III synthase [Methanomassiliicoccales archaeon]|nr:uroporphyrinogen-III synthase [Methanomassiliicoccales archaeon]
MKKTIAILGPPVIWAHLSRGYRQLAEFICVSPVRTVFLDDAGFSLFLVDAFAGKYSTVVVFDPTTADAAAEMVKRRQMQIRYKAASKNVEVIAVGEDTAALISGYGIKVSSVAPEPTTEPLVNFINSKPRRGTMALHRSDQESSELIDRLRESGWQVDDVHLYSLELDESDDMAALLDRLEDGNIDILVFPTPSNARAFMVQLEERCGKDDACSLLLGLQIVAMCPQTRQMLEGYGIKVSMVPTQATPGHLLEELMRDL